ncbi:MAG: cytochrome b5 domain-containing protein [Candidatus Peribacteria bacterium]|nr:MAG: cytochrome b5 domain-containing protein [Candidatus Peribacteria bacterium]
MTLLATSLVLTACGSQEPIDDDTMTIETGDAIAVEVEVTEYDAVEKVEDNTKSAVNTTYTLEEVAQHSTPDDCWTVIEGQVAEVTSFFGTHPGGDDNLAKACGIDATDIFESVRKHDPNGYEAVKSFVIGTLQ